MTPNTPSAAEMQQLLEELELRTNPKYQSGLEDLFLEKEGMKILAYIRQLEKEHREMRSSLDHIAKYSSSLVSARALARVSLSLLTVHP